MADLVADLVGNLLSNLNLREGMSAAPRSTQSVDVEMLTTGAALSREGQILKPWWCRQIAANGQTTEQNRQVQAELSWGSDLVVPSICYRHWRGRG